MEKYIILLVLLYCWFRIDLALADSAHTRTRKDGKELVYLQILTTNGLFAPIQLYPNDENSEDLWPDGLGSLTKLGKIQHYEFGKVVRNLYRNFITSSPVEIDAFSSAEDRSTQSLLCFLASLYAPTKEWEFLPGFHWQPIPVSYLDKDDIFFSYPENCITQVMEKKTLYNTSPGKEFILKDKFYYYFWGNHSGASIQNWNDVAILYDTLEKEKRYGYKIPEWAERYWYDMKSITDAAYGWNYQSTKSLQLKVGPLISLMTLRMRAKVVEPDPVKVSVYMTHDWNLAAFLSAIGRYNGARPPSCATVVIEMFRHSSDDQYSVRMQFFNSTTPESRKQKPHLLTLKECSEFCSLTKFVDHFQDIIPEDYYETCEGLVDKEGNVYMHFEKYDENSTLSDKV